MNLKGGKPTIHLSGEAQAQLMARIPEGRAARFHVTMSDEPPYAQAFVVIEAVDPGLA